MISTFLTFLQSAGLTPTVKYAFTADPVNDYSEDLPVIMVYPEGFEASGNLTDNLVVQAITWEVVCLLGCKLDDFEALSLEMRQAIVGTSLTANYDALEVTGASIVGLAGEYIWWREHYTTRIRFKQNTP